MDAWKVFLRTVTVVLSSIGIILVCVKAVKCQWYRRLLFPTDVRVC